MSATRSALYARLSGDATLTGLLATPTSIYHQVIPQTAAFPALVFQKASGTPDWQFAGASVQQDVWIVKAVDKASSATKAEAIAARIAAVLTDAPLGIAGSVLLAVFRESDIDYSEADGADIYRHVGARYRLVTT